MRVSGFMLGMLVGGTLMLVAIFMSGLSLRSSDAMAYLNDDRCVLGTLLTTPGFELVKKAPSPADVVIEE
jgi:hypothetical protein